MKVSYEILSNVTLWCAESGVVLAFHRFQPSDGEINGENRKFANAIAVGSCNKKGVVTRFDMDGWLMTQMRWELSNEEADTIRSMLLRSARMNESLALQSVDKLNEEDYVYAI